MMKNKRKHCDTEASPSSVIAGSERSSQSQTSKSTLSKSIILDRPIVLATKSSKSTNPTIITAAVLPMPQDDNSDSDDERWMDQLAAQEDSGAESDHGNERDVEDALADMSDLEDGNEPHIVDAEDVDAGETKKHSRPILHETQASGSASSKAALQAANEEKLRRTVFVGNVAITATDKDLKRAFSEYGRVASVRFRSISFESPAVPKKVAFIQHKLHPERDSMNAYVVMESVQTAVACLALNGHTICDKVIRVDLAENAKQHDDSRSVFVGGLPFNVTEDEIRDFFHTCGTIINVRLIRDRLTNMGKGFGYVLFEIASSVKTALTLHLSKLKEREIRVFKASQSAGEKFKNKLGKGKVGAKIKGPTLGKNGKPKHAARKARAFAAVAAAELVNALRNHPTITHVDPAPSVKTSKVTDPAVNNAAKTTTATKAPNGKKADPSAAGAEAKQRAATVFGQQRTHKTVAAFASDVSTFQGERAAPASKKAAAAMGVATSAAAKSGPMTPNNSAQFSKIKKPIFPAASKHRPPAKSPKFFAGSGKTSGGAPVFRPLKKFKAAK